MANETRVVIRLPNGSLQLKTAPFGSSSAALLATPHPVVAVFAFYESPIGNQLAEEWSGHEAFGVYDSDGAVVVQQLDTTGTDELKRRDYTANGPAGALRTIPSGLANSLAALGNAWDTYNGGSGAAYEAALVEARTLAGYPPS